MELFTFLFRGERLRADHDRDAMFTQVGEVFTGWMGQILEVGLEVGGAMYLTDKIGILGLRRKAVDNSLTNVPRRSFVGKRLMLLEWLGSVGGMEGRENGRLGGVAPADRSGVVMERFWGEAVGVVAAGVDTSGLSLNGRAMGGRVEAAEGRGVRGVSDLGRGGVP